MNFDEVYYEPDILNYELGKQLRELFKHLKWNEIESHNKIEQLQKSSNSDFVKLKRHLIIGTRKTHKYVPNFKISDFLVPYTSSGCSAMCLYCYLVCNYNKCSYLRLFVNREFMVDKIIKHTQKNKDEYVYEIGSNSDLILENTITGNLEWTIKNFANSPKGKLTFPTKFHQVDSLLDIDHNKKIIFRMSVNPNDIIKRIEIGTSSLDNRIEAINKMVDADYPTGILIAPIILVENWKSLYSELITTLSDKLSEKARNTIGIEVIFMTYSNIHRYINNDAFPTLPQLYDKELMRGRARGKYGYKDEIRFEAEEFLKQEINQKLANAKIIYIC